MIEIIFPSPSALLTLMGIGLFFGLILSIAKIKLAVERDPKIELVNEALPGANCGACGLPGCQAYATKIVEEQYEISLCPVGGDETIQKIAAILGLEPVESAVHMTARVHCQGGNAAVTRFAYNGPRTCSAATNTMGGFKICEYGCLGLGDCTRVCPFDAIHMGEEGLPVVIREKCTGCNNCVDVCPRDIITLVPETTDVVVMCLNEEKAPLMKKGCTVGCIGCKLCEKNCPEEAITVVNFRAIIDYDKCTNCLTCAEVCPVPVINPIEISKKYKKMQEKKNEEKQPSAEVTA